ncbi:MAG: hypothetical protein ACTHMX_00305 [Thermomicrobiales bacterium]
MTHDTTREDDDFTSDPASTSDAGSRRDVTPDLDATVPFTPVTAIPIPKGSPAPDAPGEPPASPADAERPPAVEADATRTAGAATWFSKLRAGRNDASPEPQASATQSTPEPSFRFSQAPEGDALTPDSADARDAQPEANTSGPDGPPVKRIVMVRHPMRRGPQHDIVELLGVDGSALSPRPFQVVLGAGAALVLLALLANNAGLALTVLSAIVPLLLLIALTGGRSALSSDKAVMLAMTGLGGVVVGGVLGWVAARVTASDWFNTGVLNFGAAGYGGRFAHAAGNAGWLIWLVNGLVLPIVAMAASLAIPVALHRSGRFEGVTGNGLLLGAAAGAGYAIGTATVFWSPLNVHAAPGFDVSDWTLMTIGIAVLQPVVAVLALAALGKAIWRYLEDRQLAPAVLPTICGLGGILLLRLGSIWIQPRQERLWLEFCWTVLVVAGVAVLYRLTIARHPGSAR